MAGFGRGLARPVVSTKTVGYPARAKRVARLWCRCHRKSHRMPARITTGGLAQCPYSPVRAHQGVRARGIRHRPFAVDAVEAEEVQDLDCLLQPAAARPGGANRPRRGSRGHPCGSGARDASGCGRRGRRSPRPRKANRRRNSSFGIGEQVLVEGQVYLARPELLERHVVVYAPEEEVALEVVAGRPDLASPSARGNPRRGPPAPSSRRGCPSTRARAWRRRRRRGAGGGGSSACPESSRLSSRGAGWPLCP